MCYTDLKMWCLGLVVTSIDRPRMPREIKYHQLCKALMSTSKSVKEVRQNAKLLQSLKGKTSASLNLVMSLNIRLTPPTQDKGTMGLREEAVRRQVLNIVRRWRLYHLRRFSLTAHPRPQVWRDCHSRLQPIKICKSLRPSNRLRKDKLLMLSMRQIQMCTCKPLQWLPKGSSPPFSAEKSATQWYRTNNQRDWVQGPQPTTTWSRSRKWSLLKAERGPFLGHHRI